MSGKLSWSIGAGSPGGSIGQSGSLETEAVMMGSISVDPQSNKALQLALDDLDRLNFFAIKSSRYSDNIKVKGSGNGAKEVKLAGPLLLFGDAVRLLGPSLATLTVTNSEAAGSAPADLEILVGRKLT